MEESSGEISEGQRPLLNAAEESVLTGHSLIDQQRSAQPRNTEVSPHATLTSPGQVLTDHTGIKTHTKNIQKAQRRVSVFKK